MTGTGALGRTLIGVPVFAMRNRIHGRDECHHPHRNKHYVRDQIHRRYYIPLKPCCQPLRRPWSERRGRLPLTARFCVTGFPDFFFAGFFFADTAGFDGTDFRVFGMAD